MVDQQRIQLAVAAILEAIGEDLQREGLKGTPERVARMYGELFSGVGVDPRSALDTTFQEETLRGDAVLVKDVPFFSICEHHLTPFFGHAHMGYIPVRKIAGASKLVRALEVLARRPQLQERMTSQLADAIHDALAPGGVAVVVEAEHLCMSMRGVKKPGSLIVTSATRGQFQGLLEDRGVTRIELLALLQRRER